MPVALTGGVLVRGLIPAAVVDRRQVVEQVFGRGEGPDRAHQRTRETIGLLHWRHLLSLRRAPRRGNLIGHPEGVAAQRSP
jgi:hypothetical protein